MPSGSMRKVVIHKAGGYEQLKLETHPVPELGDREVLIRTEAVGVNYADICVRWGVYESARRFVGWPITPGFEYSGRVEDVGREVKHVKPPASRADSVCPSCRFSFGLIGCAGASALVVWPLIRSRMARPGENGVGENGVSSFLLQEG